MYSTILTHADGGILTITLNRPEALNALNRELLAELRDALESSYTDNSVRGLIITGAGKKAFAAGADIREISELNPQNARKFSESGQEIFALVENHSKPVIGAINGFALGGGCELAMSCHLRIADKNARFGQPEVNLGLIPGYGGTQRLTHLIGKARALELMLTGDMIDSKTALQYGLINHISEDHDQLIDTAKRLMQKILSKAPHAVSGVIESVNARFTDGLDGYQVEAQVFGNCFSMDDFREGVNAFLEKRNPNFTGN